MNIPACDIGLIGGSTTLSIDMPETLALSNVLVEKTGLVFNTPFGISPEFKIFNVRGDKQASRVLSCKMHGWRKEVSRADASRQIFWVFKHAGVKRILSEGGVGAVNHLLNPRDLVVPDDYVDNSTRKDVAMDDHYLLMMRDALCPEMRRIIGEVCIENWDGRVFDRGIYINTDGRHFESPSEINHYRIAGGDVVGHSVCPEIYLAREIGACYAGLFLVVNYAEDVVTNWRHRELQELFYTESCAMGRLLVNIIKNMPPTLGCECASLNKQTLYMDIN